MIEADISGLRKLGLSDIFSDDWTRTIYSVDASHCTLKPSAVNFPSEKFVTTHILAEFPLHAGVRAQDC